MFACVLVVAWRLRKETLGLTSGAVSSNLHPSPAYFCLRQCGHTAHHFYRLLPLRFPHNPIDTTTLTTTPFTTQRTTAMHPKKRYTYQADMPYARQPFKAIYVFQRLFTSIVMCAWWAVYYSIMPRSRRPRPSWTIKCILSVNFTRRI